VISAGLTSNVFAAKRRPLRHRRFRPPHDRTPPCSVRPAKVESHRPPPTLLGAAEQLINHFVSAYRPPFSDGDGLKSPWESRFRSGGLASTSRSTPVERNPHLRFRAASLFRRILALSFRWLFLLRTLRVLRLSFFPTFPPECLAALIHLKIDPSFPYN